MLRWSAAGAPGVSGYRVYRSVDGGEYTRLTDVAASVTEYPDRSVADGHQYRYYVVARGAGGESSADAVVRTLWRAPP
ncbi:MAG: fibronectin type III domain-containing protein, partial [bacterium]|nr:fibronectin type III domain-containing protein [bacterium]